MTTGRSSLLMFTGRRSYSQKFGIKQSQDKKVIVELTCEQTADVDYQASRAKADEIFRIRLFSSVPRVPISPKRWTADAARFIGRPRPMVKKQIQVIRLSRNCRYDSRNGIPHGIESPQIKIR